VQRASTYPTRSSGYNDERGLHQDYDEWLEELAPHEPIGRYRHNRTGDGNGDTHLKRQIMGREVVVAITEGRGPSGLWPVGADLLRRVRWEAEKAGAGQDHRRIEGLGWCILCSGNSTYPCQVMPKGKGPRATQ